MVEIAQEIVDAEEEEVGEEMASETAGDSPEAGPADITQEVRIVEALLFAALAMAAERRLAEFNA